MTHEVRLFQTVLDRVLARRGRRNLYENIDPKKTALVVIDLQNCWLLPGQPAYLPAARDIVDGVNRIANTLRGCGGTVAWVQMNGSEQVAQEWPRLRDFFSRQDLFAAWSEALTPGAVGYELWSGLDVAASDIVVEKRRYSAFIQGSSDLKTRLDARGIDTLLIAGTATNVCCESSARDAQMLNYKVVMLSDANACRSDEEHNAALSNVLVMFGDVRPVDEVIADIERSRG